MIKSFFKTFTWEYTENKFFSILGFTLSLLGYANIDKVVLPSLGNWKLIIIPIAIFIPFFLIKLILWFVFLNRVKIDSSRAEHDQKLYDIIQGCKYRLWSVSIAGRSLIKLDSNKSLFNNLIAQNVDIRILSLDPNSQFTIYREHSEDDDETGRIKQRIKDSLTFWNEISRKVDKKLKGNFEFKVHQNGELNQSILIADNKIFVVPYLYKELGEHSPVIYIDKNSQPKIFAKFEQTFKSLWFDGVTPDSSMFHQKTNKAKFDYGK
ncbi:hypothetical protein [Sporocytophaga myxococcoides]|uniref:hypothetical protein n=1 Tax=Sporocytophaga myxococcoides TaxID=153721 RepID=UPI00040E41E0|nr:hypothetical protein [Sporocytophaga myxococcoides]